MARLEEATGEIFPADVLERLNKTMDDLIMYRNIYQSTIETANERMGKIEKRLAEKSEAQIQIDKLEGIIERLSNDVNELLEGHEKILSQLEKERKEDLNYIKAMENELKSHIMTTDDSLREVQKDIAKANRELEGANKLKKAFASLIKAIME